MWITTSLMSFGAVVLLTSLLPISLSSSLPDTFHNQYILLEEDFGNSTGPRTRRQLFREDIPHHRPLSGNHYARHHGFPHPGRFTDRPSRPVPVRPAGGGDDDVGNNIDGNFNNGGFDGGNGFQTGNFGPPLNGGGGGHTDDPTTVTIHNEIIHDEGHGGHDGHGHHDEFQHGHGQPHPPPPPPPPPPHHHSDEPSGGYGYGPVSHGYGHGGGGPNFGLGHESGAYGHAHEGGAYGYGHGRGHGQGDGQGGQGVEYGHTGHGGPHKTVVHYHPVQYGNFLPIGGGGGGGGGGGESVTYSPSFGYGPQGSPAGPEVSTGFGGGYGHSPPGPPPHHHHHGGGGSYSSFTSGEGPGVPHVQSHPPPHHKPHFHGKEPLGVPIPIPVLTHFHHSRPRRPKGYGGGGSFGGKIPIYVVHGHKLRRRPHFNYRRPNKARWIVNYGH